MATEDLNKALIPQSSFDSCFASNKVGRSGLGQDTGVPTVFRDPIFSPVASPAFKSSDNSHNYSFLGSNDLAAQEALARDFALALEGPLIGELTSSQVISEEYAKADPVYLSKTQALPLNYSHYRPVLGDGNCGWRAVAFSYFEKLIEPANQAMLYSEVARITSLNNLLTTAGFDEWLFEDMVEETITLLKDLSKIGESCQALEHSKKLLLQHFNDSDTSNSIIYHLRLLASAWLKTNSEKYEAFIPDGLSVEAYSKNWIEPVNQEIDHLGMTLLIDVLLKPIPFRVEIVYLDRSERSHANTYIFQPEDSNGVPIDPGSPVIHLLYRPSHYDILYKDTISTPVYLINEVPQDVNIQVNRVTSFREPRYLSFEGSGLHNSARLSSLPNQIFDMLACIPGFQLPLQQSSDQSKLKGGSQFRPSKYECDTATSRAGDSPMSSEQMLRSSSPGIGSPSFFNVATFKDSHYNSAHYNNPNFQPEQWLPESEERPRDKPDGRRKKAILQSTSNELSLRDTLVIDIDQSLANLEVSPKKTSSHEHKGLVAVSAKDTDGSEIHCEQPSTTDDCASQNAETEQVLPLDSSDGDYESSDLGDFSKVFEAVQCLTIEGIAQDSNQKVRDTATPLSIVKQTAFDQGMHAFWILFDQAWSAEFTGCVTSNETSPRTTNLPTTGACNILTAALTTVTALGKRSRNEDDSEAPDDDDRSNGNKRNKSNPSSKSSMIASGFACPYRKHDALQYSVGKWKICALTPQSTVARVKEHLYRYHRVHQCQRCKDSFKQEKELDAHFEAKEGCESRPMKIVEGITAKMEKQLRCRKKAYRGQSDAERWKDIYKLLFPLEAVPDPYFDPVQEHKGEQSSPSSDSQDIAEYEGYLRRELPRCFRRALEAAINDDNDPMEERLTSRIMDMYQDCQDLVLSSYRTTLEAASTPIPASVPEPTIVLIAQVAEYNLAAWNTGISMDVDDPSNKYPDHPQQYDGNATPPKGSTTMQSNKAVNGNTGNDFNFDFTPNGLGLPPQELPSSTSIADWQTSNEIAVYPVEMDTVPLRHVDVPNSFEWADLLSLDP